MGQCNAISFNGQKVYCGIDVHKKEWHVCVRSNGLQLECKPFVADAQLVIGWLKKNFPGAEVHSVYEAGFCGFSAHRAFVAAGIHSIVINPADVPTTDKERAGKCDRTDCRKLAKHLEDGSLTPIDVPSVAIECLRGLVRHETQVRDAATRTANQLKSALYFHGRHPVPKLLSEKALRELEMAMGTETEYAYAQEILSLVRQLRWLREERKALIATERATLEKYELMLKVLLLTTIPGIGFRTAVILLAELADVSRFKSRSDLAAYVGLAPHAYGSGEDERDRASGSRKKKRLHYVLIQAAWAAASKDRWFSAYFGHLCQGRKLRKTRAIVSVAKKLLMIVQAVLRDGKPYKSPLDSSEKPAAAQLPVDSAQACARALEEAMATDLNEEDALLSLPVDLL